MHSSILNIKSYGTQFFLLLALPVIACLLLRRVSGYAYPSNPPPTGGRCCATLAHRLSSCEHPPSSAGCVVVCECDRRVLVFVRTATTADDEEATTGITNLISSSDRPYLKLHHERQSADSLQSGWRFGQALCGQTLMAKRSPFLLQSLHVSGHLSFLFRSLCSGGVLEQREQ